MSGATTRYFLASWGIIARQVSELPAMPWISSNVSPLPASRYATRSPCSSRYLSSPIWTGSPCDSVRIMLIPPLEPGQIEPGRLVAAPFVEADGVGVAGQRTEDQVVDPDLVQVLLESFEQFGAQAAAAVLR